jgi:hypothetical protein
MELIASMARRKQKDKVLRLNKNIYGLVQAVRQWHGKFSEEIIKLGYKGNNVKPCVFTKLENFEFCILCIDVDDGIITGSERMMKDTIDGLNKVFKHKLKKPIKQFLG